MTRSLLCPLPWQQLFEHCPSEFHHVRKCLTLILMCFWYASFSSKSYCTCNWVFVSGYREFISSSVSMYNTFTMCNKCLVGAIFCDGTCPYSGPGIISCRYSVCPSCPGLLAHIVVLCSRRSHFTLAHLADSNRLEHSQRSLLIFWCTLWTPWKLVFRAQTIRRSIMMRPRTLLTERSYFVDYIKG
jgi:hypothetical protein